MNKIQIIELLAHDYLLTANQKDILVFLSQNEATAEKILKETSVSSGRIYKILGEMVGWGIIDKSTKKPSLYSMKSFSVNVRNFIDNRLKQNMDSQKRVIESLSEYEAGSKVEIVSGTKKECDIEIINMFNQAKWARILHKHVSLPWFLYVYFSDEDFLKVRNIIAKERPTGSSSDKFDLLSKRESYLKLYKEQEVEQIMLKDTLINYLKSLKSIFPEKDEKYSNILKESLKSHPNVKIRVLESLNTPFSVYLTDRQVLMPVFAPKKQNRMIKMIGKEYVDIYTDYLNSFSKNSTEVSEVFE